MALVDIRLGYKNSAWFTSNASLVLKEGQTVHLLQTGTYKIGDGTTQLSGLSFLGAGSGSTDLPYTSYNAPEFNFSSNAILGYHDVPLNGTFTLNEATPILGAVNIAIHSDLTAPSFPDGFSKIQGNYVTGVLNFIEARYMGLSFDEGNKLFIYKIFQEI